MNNDELLIVCNSLFPIAISICRTKNLAIMNSALQILIKIVPENYFLILDYNKR